MQTVSKQGHTLAIVVIRFLSVLNSATGGPWYAGVPLLVIVYVVGALELAVGLGGRDVPCGQKAASFAASIVCGAVWLAVGFAAVNTGFGCGC